MGTLTGRLLVSFLYNEFPDIFQARRTHVNNDLENNIPMIPQGQAGGNHGPNGGNDDNNHMAILFESVAWPFRHARG
jgi:hypothetical protein